MNSSSSTSGKIERYQLFSIFNTLRQEISDKGYKFSLFWFLQVLNDQTFAIMVLMALFTTFITTPIVMAVYKPARQAKKEGEYKHRTVERENTNTQLRILTCFHGAGSIPSMINLLEASRGIEKGEGLCVYALHLRELSERSSAILMVHKVRKNGMPFWNRRGINAGSDADQVVVAFQAFQQLSRVNVRPMTAISSMSDIHEDICTTAARKKAAIVILPFHKHQQLDGSLETTRGDYRWVNRRVLREAPCSVGIFVDRGLGGSSQVSAQDVSYSVVVLFFGGRDDREALAYGLRMAEHPGISLTVFRFVVSPERIGEIARVEVDNNNQNVKNNLKSDEEIMSEIRKKSSADESIKFVEKRVENAAVDVRSAIEEMRRSNLFLVGRMPGGEIALAIRENSECPELGPVGSLLISPESSTRASVLVIQQYNGTGTAPDLASSGTELLTSSTDKDSE